MSLKALTFRIYIDFFYNMVYNFIKRIRKGIYMYPDKFVITEFKNIFEANDPAGRKTIFTDRYAASFIITLKGKIAFHYGGKTVISDKDNPVFLPKGLCYENECIEDAYSLGFSFYTLESYREPHNLHKIQ